MKVLAASILSLSLLAATTPAMAFGAPVNAQAPKPAAKIVPVAQNTQPVVTDNTGNAQDIAKQRRRHHIFIAFVTAGVIVGAIAASHGSGTTGTTKP